MPFSIAFNSTRARRVSAILLFIALAGCGGGGHGGGTAIPVSTIPASQTTTEASTPPAPTPAAAASMPASASSAPAHAASDNADTPSPVDAVDSQAVKDLADQVTQEATLSNAASEVDAPASPSGFANCSIDLYGDSIMYGAYEGSSRFDEPPAAALARIRPAYTIVDRSRSGDSVKAHRAAFHDEQRTGRITVFEWGINDMGQDNLALPVQYSDVIQTAKHEGHDVIVTGLSRQSPPIAARDTWDIVIKSVAKLNRVSFANWGAVPIQPGDTPDGLHPAKGYSDLLVLQLAFALDKIAPECSGAAPAPH